MSEQTDTQPTVNPLGFSEWSSENNFNDPLESRVKYGDYLREQYINAEAYNPTVEQEISTAFAQSLQQEGLLTEENVGDVEQRISAIQGSVSLDQEARNMRDSLSSTEDAQTLSDYLSAADVDAPSPEYLEELQPLKSKATEIVNNEKDARARAMIDAGEIPMAKLSSGELLVGEAAERMGIVAAIKSSKSGGVTMSDAIAAKAQLNTPDGWEIPLYKIKNLTDIYRLLEVEQKADEDFSLIIDGLSTELAESEYDAGDRMEKWLDGLGRSGVNFIRRISGKGEDVDKENARRRAIEEARGTNIRQLAAKYALKFDKRPEDVERALKQLSVDNANKKQMFEFHDEDDEIGKNIRFLGFGLPSVSPQALVNKDVFDKAIAAHPDMSQNVKDALDRQRVNYLQSQFVDYNKLLSQTSVADEWSKALITGRASGVEDYRILEAFVADEDNYNEFKERLSGLGASVWHGFGQIIHAIPAGFGLQMSKDYLASVAQKNSNRRQLAEVFGEEFGFLQDVGETAFPMLIDVGLTALLAAGTAPLGGSGAVAYASMKAGGRASASLAGKGVTKALFSNVFRRKAGKSITEQADELLGEGLIKGTRSGAVDILKNYNGKLASKLGIAPAVFVPAATRSGSATYGAVYNQLRQNPDITEEEAHDRALGSMLLAGTFTGIITSSFSLIGKGGLEDALLKGLTYKQMNTVAKSVTNMVEGDLFETAQKAISTTMKKYAFGGVKGLMKNFADEGVEEGIDEFVNGLITDAALNENTPFLERLQQTWHAVVLGGTMGAGVPVAQFALRPLKPAATSSAQMGAMFDEVLTDMARDLTDNGAPITAEVLSAIASDTRRKDARLSVVPTPQEQEDILEEQRTRTLVPQDSGVPLASGITSDEKFSQELETSVNPDSVAEAVAETLASSTPVVSGADPNTVETKGSLMRSLGMQVREASSVENTDHQSVRDLLVPPVAGTEPDYFEGARPLARQLVLDPSRQSEADAIEASYTERIQKVNEAEARYRKMDREAQPFEMAAGLESPVRKGLRRAVQEGKAISPEKAAELRGDVFKDRILALKKLKIEQSVEQEEQEAQELPASIEAPVNFLINSGFQHIVTIPKLKRLGIPVNARTTSEPFLRSVNRRIAKEVTEKFPKLKITKPANGSAIKSVYGQGQVFVDQNQVGQFDNDPVAMLTLLELGTPIVVSEEALSSPTLNPAFRFTQVGETTVVSNIMVPESRGLVSALTPAERALALRPDYSPLSELVNTVTSLRGEGIQNPDALISSPFNPDEKITVEEAMSKLEQSADVTEFLQPTRRGLTEPFAATAAIELRLRAQEALFRGDTVSLEGLGNQVANRYQQEQEARLNHQKEVFMSTVSPENAAELQADPDFNPESETSDTYTAYPEEDPILFSPSELSGLLKDAQSNAIAAITGDQELKTRVVNLVQNEVFTSTTIDFDRVSNKALWGYLVQWMAQGNSRAHPASITFQKELKGNRFDMGRPVRDALRIMTLSSNSIEGTIQNNSEYRSFLKDQIRSLRGVEASDGQVTEFFNFIRRSIGELHLRSQPTAMSLAEVQQVNLEAIAALGLKSGDSSSIIEALRRIAGVSSRTQKKYDKNLVALARLLLKSPDYINTIELTIDETNQNYAGNFDILNDGTPAISINISGHNPRGVADTLLHELTHAFVTNVTRKSPAQQTRQEANAIGVLEQTVRGIRERLNVRGSQLTKVGYTNNDPRVLDGVENIDEFVAHFLTSTDFQAVVKVISDQQNNFFQRAIDAIVAFFNPTQTEIPQFTEIFSSVLDLSQAAIATAGPRKKKATISMDEFVALQDEGRVNSESLSTTAADYIADKVFPASPATNSTIRKEPVTANSLANKVAHDIIQSQQEQVRLASNVQAATGVDPTTQQEIISRIEETVSYVEGLVSPETQIEINNEIPVMAEVDPKTGVLTINPLKLSGLVLELQQRNGGRPVPVHTRRGILAVVINEEVAHAASVSALTTTEIQEIMDSMTLADAYRAIDAYGDDSAKAGEVRESMKMGWRTGNPEVKSQVVEEMLRQHAQRVTRGFTTEEDVAFLRSNPSLLQYIIRYFKSFLKKLGYYRSRGDITPQLRVAVDRMVNEIRAMESGFRVQSNFAPFDANNPASAVEKFRKQINMNKPIERPDAGVPALASGITTLDDEAQPTKYQIIDRHTGLQVGADYTDKKRARSRRERLDLEYGGYRYGVREVSSGRMLSSGITADALSLSPVDAPLDLSGIGVTAGSRVNTAQGREAEDSTFEAYEQQDSYVINSVSVAKYVAFQGRKNLRGRPTQVRGKDTLVYKQLKALDDRRVEMFPATAIKATLIKEINSASRVSDALVKRIANKLYTGEAGFTGTEAQMANVKGLIDFVRGADRTTLAAAKEWRSQTNKDILDEMRPLADEVYDTVSAFAVDNLVHLYDSMHPVMRERAKLWYEGANRIAQDMAKRYNITLEQSSTALAVLSPQKDWFQNVSLAGRVMEVVTKNKQNKYTKSMADKALQMAENISKSAAETAGQFQKRKKEVIYDTKKFNDMMLGKTLGQLIKQAKKGTESETLPARYVRIFDQLNHPRGYAILSPEGDRLGLQVTKKNTIAAVGWGSYKEIQKAIDALLTTDEAVHSDLLGEQHKVRNFRNNIADPANSDDGTIDTHAVSALYFIPVAGADTEVAHNFASSKGEDKISSSGSKQFGINGTYALNLKAHQDAAAFINERDGTNLSTREIQSITWEQIRTLFLPEQKREKASYAKKEDKETVLDESRQIWDKTTDDGEARQLIEERFGGYGFPDWATPRELRSVAEDTAYAEKVRLKRLPSSSASGLSDPDASGDPDGTSSAGVTGLKSGIWSPAAHMLDVSSNEAAELLSDIRLDGAKESSKNRFLTAAEEANKSLDDFDLEGASIFLAEDNSAGVAVSPVTESEGGDLFIFDSRDDNKNVIGILELLEVATSQEAIADSSGNPIKVATVKVKDINNLPTVMHQTFGFSPYSRVLSEDAPETVFMGRDSIDGFYNSVAHPYENQRETIPTFNSEELASDYRARRMADIGISLVRRPMTTREKIRKQTEQEEPSVTLGDIIKGLPATLVSGGLATDTKRNLFGTTIKENARMRISAKALDRIRQEKARIAEEEPMFREEGAIETKALRSGVQVESAKILTLSELRGLDSSVNEAVQDIENDQGRPLDEGQQASIMSGIFGAVSDLPSEFNDAGVDYSEFIELLELPLIEKSVGFNKIGGTFKKLFLGETDPTVQRFSRQRDAFLRSGDKIVEEYHLKYKRAIEKDYDPDNTPWETIQTASGTTNNIDPDPDGAIADARDKAKIDIQRKYAAELSNKITQIEDAYDNARANIKATEPDAGKRRQLRNQERKKKNEAITRETELNKAAKGAEEDLADISYKADIKKAFAARKDKMMRDRDAALKQIQVESPDLFNVLLDLRRLTDELSVKARDLFGRHDKGVLVKFDNNLGLYVTRRYRMFSETDYVDRILKSNEEADVAVRSAAIDFMHDQFIENETRRQIAANPSISESDARAEAERVYNSKELGGQSLGYQMITEFLSSYDTETGPEDFASAFALAGMPKTKEPQATGALRAIVKNLQGRAEIPKPLADLMGANNIPEDSVDNLLYAFSTVAKIASHQHFLESMRQQGIENGWLFTKEKYNDLLKEPDGYTKYANRFRQIQNSGADSGLNPLAGLYVEKDIYNSILPMFQQTTRAGNDAASSVMGTSLAVAQRLTGAAMAAKTLFSLGFYLRNALGNVLFFGPAQGYIHSAKDIFSGNPMSGTGMSMFSAIKRAVQGNRAETSAYLRSLEGLDVFGNEVRSEIMIRLLRGEETTDGVQAQLSDLASKASSKKTPAHARRVAADTMARLAGAMDTFYKIGYFEHELAVLRKAYKADLAAGKISEIDLKREAAEIIGDTAQSYSRALPIIKKFTGSGAGLLIAPFVRFTAEVPRIAVNTIRRGVKEMGSDNPVIKARGYQRLAGFAAVTGGLSMAVPTLLRVVLSGMGEEEDEAFRMSLPPYLRNHTFFIQKLDNGDIKSWDLTYLNPFSVIADPMLRTLEHAVRGEPLTAATKLVTSSFVDPYLGDQIFAGAVFDIRENRNARNDNPIWEETDTLPLRIAKMARYLGEEAYGPRTPLKLIEAYQALGRDEQSFDNSAFGIIFNEAMPVVPKTKAPIDMFERVVFKMRDEQTRAQRKFGELKKTAGMTEGQVARIHRDIRKSRMRINSQLSRAMKGFRGMGVSNNDMYQAMKGARYGKRRSQLLFTGFMENPVPPKNMVDDLMTTEVGRERLRILMEEHANYARFLRLDDD